MAGESARSKATAADDLSQDHIASKRARPNGPYYWDSNLSPDFYDNLSKRKKRKSISPVARHVNLTGKTMNPLNQNLQPFKSLYTLSLRDSTIITRTMASASSSAITGRYDQPSR
ncbi:hypothetical protein BX600DRAFT_72301 [Xylariales sp. PMI_506]|nr:hypothetical protein BX600DRAFT_72301 [Xylariales sp. PMI_506]